MKIGFIGTGHMASSIAIALSQNKNYELLLNNRTPEKAIALKEKIGAQAEVYDIKQIVEECDYLFIGVKPIDLKDLLMQIKDYVSHCIYISMAAGCSLKEIQDILNNRQIIRIMPNTPVAINEGITFVSYNDLVTDKDAFVEIMKETGSIFEIDEDKMDAASTIAGSGPAYIDFYLDSLIKIANRLGFDESQSQEIVLQMAKGTIDLDLSSDLSPLELGKQVCSPGGSTIEGINVLLNDGLYELVDKALLATYNKNKKMK